jgi:hypothetical protein
MTTSAISPRRLLYVVNEDWAFLLNRLPMARAAEVHVATTPRLQSRPKVLSQTGPLMAGQSRTAVRDSTLQ